MQDTERIAAHERKRKARVNRRIETKKIRTGMTTIAPAQTTYKLILKFRYLESRKQLIMVCQALVVGAM